VIRNKEDIFRFNGSGTTGLCGVIKFIDYNAKKSHYQKHGIAKLLFSAGSLLVVAGIIACFA
jgi:hypothetical protein